MNVEDPEAHKDPSLLPYKRTPTRSLYENLRFKTEAKALLPNVSTHVLLIEGRYDCLVAPGSARYIAEQLKNAKSRMVVTFLRSGHGLPVDYDKDEMHWLILEFIRKYG